MKYKGKIFRKIKIDKLDSFKIISYCSPRDTVRKMTRQVTDWEKKFVKDVLQKDL